MTLKNASPDTDPPGYATSGSFESFHPNYWGQLALRNSLRQAVSNGDVRGGTCEFMQAGLDAFDEPTMILSQP